MKKLLYTFATLLLLLATSSSILVKPAAALLEKDPKTLMLEYGEQDGTVNFTFAQLGEDNIQLRSPLDAYEINFSLPYRWVAQPGEGTYLDLAYNLTILQDSSYLSEVVIAEQLPHLEIYLDNVLIYGFTPSIGFGQVERIPIPVGVLNSSSSNTHNLRMFYFRDNDCDDFLSSVLEINSLTSIGLTYEVVSPLLSLAQFPRPMVQDSFFGEHLYLVLPDEASASDLATAAVVSAAVGDQGRGIVEITTLYASEAVSDVLGNRNVIAIGQPDTNSFIAQAYSKQSLSTGLDSSGNLVAPGGALVSEDAGVLQMFSPAENRDLIYLLVTGATSQAVEKAAYALSSADPQYGLVGDWAVIDQIYANVLPASDDDQSSTMLFDDLGYNDTEYYGIGTRSDTFTFYIPHTWELTYSPSVTISYAHSSMLSATNSLINLELNGKLVGSVPISVDALGEVQTTVQLRPEDFNTGEKNRLRITPIMDINRGCERYDTNLTWLRIHGESYLNLPHRIVDSGEDGLSFTNPFFYLLSSPDVNQIVFHLPEDFSKTELNGLVQVAQLLGQERRFSNQSFAVSFDQVLPDTYSESHVIAIGTPVESPIIQEYNDLLPQSFVPGENTLRQVVGNVEYILANDFSVGVIEVIPSPLNPSRGMSVITGTTDEGLAWALRAMSDPDLMRRLSGDLAFVSDQEVEAIKTSAATREYLQVALEGVVGSSIPVDVVENPDDQLSGNSAAGETVQDEGFSITDFLPVVFGALLAAAILVTGISFSRNVRHKGNNSSGNGG